MRLKIVMIFKFVLLKLAHEMKKFNYWILNVFKYSIVMNAIKIIEVCKNVDYKLEK